MCRRNLYYYALCKQRKPQVVVNLSEHASYEDVELGQHPCMGIAGPLYLWVNSESDHFQKLQRHFLHFVSL